MTSKRSPKVSRTAAAPAVTSSYTEESHSFTSVTNNDCSRILTSQTTILPIVVTSSDKSLIIPPKKQKPECPLAASSSSHTQYFRRKLGKDEFEMITSDQYVGVTESISGSSDTYRCVHGPKGKRYTKKGQLKRNLLKLDAVKIEPQWTASCKLPSDLDVVKTLTYLIRQPKHVQYPDRMRENFNRFNELYSDGYPVNVLDNLFLISEFLLDNAHMTPNYMKEFVTVLENMAKPIKIYAASDVIKNMDKIRDFMAYLGYLMMMFGDDKMFDLVGNALLFHLSAPDSQRGTQSFRRHHMTAASAKVLVDTIIRGIAVSSPHRFQVFIKIAFILACDSVENCIDFMKENILESIFYRFNPYFPCRDLPPYDDVAMNTGDLNVKLGESSKNMPTVLSLLLVLLKTTKEYLEKNPDCYQQLPPPCSYAQRCFVWVFRFECRCKQLEQVERRLTLAVIANVLIIIYKNQLDDFGSYLMPDVMALSVRTEVYPARDNWTRQITFNAMVGDNEFKRLLIHLSVDFLTIFPYNRYMVKSLNWMVGLMYLVDPGLSATRAKWSSAVYAELRKTALQAIIISMNYVSPDLATELSLIRRLMWYVEWFSQNPYELYVLYWVLRLLQKSMFNKYTHYQKPAIRELFRTHGVIVLMNLCNTLLDVKRPPLEMGQSVIGLVLALLRNAVNLSVPGGVVCVVYPSIRWPSSLNGTIRRMMHLVGTSLERNYYISDRWLISMLNLIWEGLVWKKPYRDKFLEFNGVYKLLDIITMTRRPVQCVAMALICDILRAGDGVAQLITWRASYAASNACPLTVKRGASIATLLAKLCTQELMANNIHLDSNNILKGKIPSNLKDLDFPLMSNEIKKHLFAPKFAECNGLKCCLAAADLAGSTISKCFAILQMLSEDLEQKVALADEAYNLYKNVELDPEVESMLVLCSYFLTLKINAAWLEAQIQTHAYVPEDTDILDEFINIGRGWAKHIQQQQFLVLEKYKSKEGEKERSLDKFLRRVSLNTSLDALTIVRCNCRSTDRSQITHALILEAVKGYHRRAVHSKKLGKIVTTTYDPPLDDQNLIGQNIKMISIPHKTRPKKRHPEFEGSSPNSAVDLGAGDAQTQRQRISDPSPTASHGSRSSQGSSLFAEESRQSLVKNESRASNDSKAS